MKVESSVVWMVDDKRDYDLYNVLVELAWGMDVCGMNMEEK